MLRRIFRSSHASAHGQALVLFAAGLIGFLGLVGMSVDVGRYVWARTQMQAAVDAAALAAAQSMPDTSMATSKAGEYWTDNSSFIQAAGENVAFSVTFPPGNKALRVEGQADIPTFFLRFVGIARWHVTAEGEAASQVLDIGLVLDISGSMCWGNYTPADRVSATGPFGPQVGPGRTADAVQLTAAVPAGGTSITITVNSTAIFNSTSATQNQAKFGWNMGTQRYFQYLPGNGRRGLIKIDGEYFLITAIPSATTMTVTRAQRDNFLGVNTVAAAHAVGAGVWSQHANCSLSGPSVNGPYEPYDGSMVDAQYFTTLFNPAYDKIGLASFSGAGNIRRGLTSNFSQVRGDMDAISNPDGGTNSAFGLALGRQVLDGAGKRANAVRVMVFLTDGLANSYCGSAYSAANYNAPSCPGQGGGSDGNASAVNAAYAEAQRAVSGEIQIYTIGLGPFANDAFLKRLADGGVAGVGPCQQNQQGCRFFKAPSVADLDGAFKSIAEQTHIALTR
ncbi:MAG: hypothetical protein C0506_01030 [Anaerolinea sp.]|nr:hypothetical protein [Anaerolinea sp.]